MAEEDIFREMYIRRGRERGATEAEDRDVGRGREIGDRNKIQRGTGREKQRERREKQRGAEREGGTCV